MRPQPWLAPFGPAYAVLVGAKNAAYDRGLLSARRLRSSVISVGNLSTGGGGKTPLVIAMAKLLTGAAVSADVLSRGYGRSNTETACVSSGVDDAAACYGDEPVLIANATGVPVFVGVSRYAAGLVAEQVRRAQVHLLDDGFQHRQLARDLDIVVLHRSDFSERLLPAGHLREPLHSLRRADVAVLREEDRDLVPKVETYLSRQGDVWFVQRAFSCEVPQTPAVAFCGIARPQEFFDSMTERGVATASTVIFSDHHRFSAPDLRRLVDECRRVGAETLITTEKDAVRLGAAGRATLMASVQLSVATLEAKLLEPERFLAKVNQLLPR